MTLSTERKEKREGKKTEKNDALNRIWMTADFF
jgi:hypothetical protein